MQAMKDKVVSIYYTLTDDTGKVLDKTGDDAVFSYLHGNGNIIPGLEKAIDGKNPGDAFQVRVEPDDAYGPRDDSHIFEMDKEPFDSVKDLAVGMQIPVETDHGVHILTIREINGDKVTVDANHPLAGVTLNFDVRLQDVRDATADEIEHGHVHDEDGCDCDGGCDCDEECDDECSCGHEKA